MAWGMFRVGSEGFEADLLELSAKIQKLPSNWILRARGSGYIVVARQRLDWHDESAIKKSYKGTRDSVD
jgi:hypothetical protein